MYAGTWRRGIFKTTDGGDDVERLKLPHNDMGSSPLSSTRRIPRPSTRGPEPGDRQDDGRRRDLDGAESGDRAAHGSRTRNRPHVDGHGVRGHLPRGLPAWEHLQDSQRRSELERGHERAPGSRRCDRRRPEKVDNAYAVLDERLVKSTNAGATWMATSPLPQGLARTVTVDPRTSTVYVGMMADWRTRKPLANSVYRSTDGGRTWHAFGRGLKSRRRAGAALTSPMVMHSRSRVTDVPFSRLPLAVECSRTRLHGERAR